MMVNKEALTQVKLKQNMLWPGKQDKMTYELSLNVMF